MSSFTNELKVKPTEDGKMWILLEDFEYYLGDLDSGVSIKVPAGFVTDFASVPQFLWWILPPFGKYTKPAVLHDYLYRKTKFNREICDGIFLEAMEVMNVPVWQRLLLYLGVRIGGWVPYRKYKKELK